MAEPNCSSPICFYFLGIEAKNGIYFHETTHDILFVNFPHQNFHQPEESGGGAEGG